MYRARVLGRFAPLVGLSAPRLPAPVPPLPHPHSLHCASAAPRRALSSFANTNTNPTYLRNSHTGTEIYLLGTAHVSETSAQQVRDLVARVRPDQLFLELDPARLAKIRRRAAASAAHHRGAPDADEAGEVDWARQVMHILANPARSVPAKVVELGFSAMYEFMRRMGFVPGGEFIAAVQEAERTGAEIITGDQDATETLRRIAEALPADIPSILQHMFARPPAELEEILRGAAEGQYPMGPSGIKETVDRLLDRRKVRVMIRHMEDITPNLLGALLRERDLVMAQELKKLNGRVVVAVVGLAHVDGIERHWHSQSALDQLRLRMR